MLGKAGCAILYVIRHKAVNCCCKPHICMGLTTLSAQFQSGVSPQVLPTA